MAFFRLIYVYIGSTVWTRDNNGIVYLTGSGWCLYVPKYIVCMYIYNICTTKWWYSFLHIFQATFWTVQRFNPIHVIYTPFGVFVLKRIDSLLNQGCWEPYTYHSGMIYTPHLLTGDLFFRFMALGEFQNPYDTNHYPII